MYVLILTLGLKVSYAGMGGVAMQEFTSLEKCESAAYKWKQQDISRGRVYDKERMTLCVEK